MSDEDLYLEATNEVNGPMKDPALWAKVMALTDGDQNKAKYQYIKLRVKQLSNNPIEQLSEPAEYIDKEVESTQSVRYLDEEFIPIDQFSKNNDLDSEVVISMIREGTYKGRIIDGNWFISTEETKRKPQQCDFDNNIGFTWWKVWAWLGLTIGNIYILLALTDIPELGIILFIINTSLMVMILKYNKYVFLLATILSLNPLLWVINGIYLKNRWNHPLVNSKKP